MAFNHAKVVGNDTTQNTVVNDSTVEAVVHNLVAYNTTAGNLTFSMLIDGSVVITETVSANGSYRLPDKINVPVNATLAVNAPTGVDITISYLQQAIDVNAALTAIQQATLDAGDLANSWATTTDATVDGGEYSAKEYAVGTTVPVGSAKEWATTPKDVLVDGVDYSAKHWAETAQDYVAALPTGTLNDTITATDSTWSSQKIQSELDQTTGINDAVTAVDSTWSSDKINTELTSKQASLVSGTNIKTLNGTSVLGSGDIALPAPNNATITVQGSNGLTGSASFTTNQATNETITLSHADTSTQASVNNSGATVIQDITLDGYGHLTAIGSKTLTTTDIGAQPALVSGTNIKTINGTSVLGSGDLTVSGFDTSTLPVVTESHLTSSDYVLVTDGGVDSKITLDNLVDELQSMDWSFGSTVQLNSNVFLYGNTHLQGSYTFLGGNFIVNGPAIQERVTSTNDGHIDPINDGSFIKYTVTRTKDIVANMMQGQSVLYNLINGSSYTVTWVGITWVGGTAPTLTANDVLVFWKDATTVYGAYVGSLA